MVIGRIHSEKHPHSIVLHDASWNFYRALLKEYDEQRTKSALGMMLGLLSLTSNVRVKQGGSGHVKANGEAEGLEADQCYWIAHESVMRTKKRIDLRTDLPPDLVIEIDVMHAVVNREKIYASLGVPEMWVLQRDRRMAAYRLSNRMWEPTEKSVSFPFLRVADFNPFVARIGVDDDMSVLADFRDWCEPLKQRQSQ